MEEHLKWNWNKTEFKEHKDSGYYKIGKSINNKVGNTQFKQVNNFNYFKVMEMKK